jgi:Protein of unknown function (DUF3618)
MGQTADELRRDIAETRSDLGNTLDAIGDRISPARMVERRKNRTMRALAGLRDRVMGSPVGPTAVAERAGDVAAAAVETTRQAPEAVRHGTEGNPLVAGFLAMGAGFLIATVIPPSGKERELGADLRERAQPLVDELTEAGKSTADHLKEPLRHAADEVASTAQVSAHEVTVAARQEADRVRDSTEGASS